jgi:hypothetical protein
MPLCGSEQCLGSGLDASKQQLPPAALRRGSAVRRRLLGARLRDLDGLRESERLCVADVFAVNDSEIAVIDTNTSGLTVGASWLNRYAYA